MAVCRKQIILTRLLSVIPLRQDDYVGVYNVLYICMRMKYIRLFVLELVLELARRSAYLTYVGHSEV